MLHRWRWSYPCVMTIKVYCVFWIVTNCLYLWCLFLLLLLLYISAFIDKFASGAADTVNKLLVRSQPSQRGRVGSGVRGSARYLVSFDTRGSPRAREGVRERSRDRLIVSDCPKTDDWLLCYSCWISHTTEGEIACSGCYYNKIKHKLLSWPQLKKQHTEQGTLKADPLLPP